MLSRSFLTLGALVLLLTVAVRAESPTPETTETEASVSNVPTGEGGAEAEVEWLKDGEGREYRLEAVPRDRGDYKLLDDGQVLLQFGVKARLDSSDDDNLFIRLYRTDNIVVPPTERVREPTEEEIAAREAELKVEIPESHSWELMPFDQGLPRRGQWRNRLAIADFDGDGFPDIAFPPSRKSNEQPVIFRGDGAGRWTYWQARYPDLPYEYGGAAAGDVDGDGRPDLVLGAHLRGLLVLRNAGDGKFENWSEGLPFQLAGKGKGLVSFSSKTPAVLDWTGDGKADLVFLGEGPRLNSDVGKGMGTVDNKSLGLHLFANRGDGRWTAKPLSNADRTAFGDDLDVADFDGDGLQDVVVVSYYQGVRDILYYGDREHGFEVKEVDGIRPHTYTRAVAVGDVYRDGKPDLVVAWGASELGGWWAGIDLLRRHEDGSWESTPVWAEPGREGVWALDVGDLDGDGALDVVATTGDGGLLLFRGDGKGAFTRDTFLRPADGVSGCKGYDVELDDLDGDGADEIVAAYAGEPSPMWIAMDPREKAEAEAAWCPTLGALRAWKVRSLAPAAAAP